LPHKFFMCVGCLVTCSCGLGKRGGSTGELHFWWCSLSIESGFSG
jgi:hypothetical protein